MVLAQNSLIPSGNLLLHLSPERGEAMGSEQRPALALRKTVFRIGRSFFKKGVVVLTLTFNT